MTERSHLPVVNPFTTESLSGVENASTLGSKCAFFQAKIKNLRYFALKYKEKIKQ